MSTFLALLSVYVFCLGVGEFFRKCRRIVSWLFRRSER